MVSLPLMRTRALAFRYVIVPDKIILTEPDQQFCGLLPAGIHRDDLTGTVENGNLSGQRVERRLK